MGLLKAIIIFTLSCIATVIIHNNIDNYKDKYFIKPIYPYITKCNTLVLIIFLILVLI